MKTQKTTKATNVIDPKVLELYDEITRLNSEIARLQNEKASMGAISLMGIKTGSNKFPEKSGYTLKAVALIKADGIIHAIQIKSTPDDAIIAQGGLPVQLIDETGFEIKVPQMQGSIVKELHLAAKAAYKLFIKNGTTPTDAEIFEVIEVMR